MSKHKSIYNLGDKLTMRDINFTSNFGRLFGLFANLTLSRFIWENLPPSIEERHIELPLFQHGEVFVFEHKDYGLVALPCSSTGELNIYGEPTRVNVTGYGQTIGVYNISDGVRIINNDMRIPSILNTLYYANMIDKTDETMLKNLDKLKLPYIITTTKENEHSYKLLIDKIMRGEDAIFIDTMLSNGGKLGIEVLNTNVPYLIGDLQQHKNNLMDDFLTIVGLNNTSANNDKKERLLVDEVNVNNGQILMYLDLDYKHRERACEEINKKFGTNIQCKKRIDILAEAQTPNIPTGTKGGDTTNE